MKASNPPMHHPTDPGTPFHEGERRVQERLGVREQIEPWAQKVVRSYLPDEHRAFYGQLPFMVAAARDDAGRPWATLLTGPPGFVASPDSNTLRFDSTLGPGDALHEAFEPGRDVGLLGIELSTRRRNRVNGRVRDLHEGGFEIEVDQTFGNCPQHITERDWEWRGPAATAPEHPRGTSLTERQRALIARADTFFIATGHRDQGNDRRFGMDASHRGGSAGFVEVTGERSLVIPDYAGNNHFNTLGNLVMDPRAGLLFCDFERGDLLQLTGRIEIDWQPTPKHEGTGAMRLLRFAVEEVVLQSAVLPLRFRTSADEEAIALRLEQRVEQTSDITSFVFAPAESSQTHSLPAFEPGQYLPIELRLPGLPRAVVRTYSLSAPSDGARYRITVKRESRGLVSRHLHDGLEPGAVLAARAPRGDFVLPAQSRRPIVLLSAGVGITPMVPMLDALAGGDVPTCFVHGTREPARFPHQEEVEALARAANVTLHVVHSRPAGDRPLPEGRSRGRVDVGLLAALLPDLDAEYFLCGPTAFLSDLVTGLSDRGVPDAQIHFESFGPAAS